jgi:hypothetical protein
VQKLTGYRKTKFNEFATTKPSLVPTISDEDNSIFVQTGIYQTHFTTLNHTGVSNSLNDVIHSSLEPQEEYYSGFYSQNRSDCVITAGNLYQEIDDSNCVPILIYRGIRDTLHEVCVTDNAVLFTCYQDYVNAPNFIKIMQSDGRFFKEVKTDSIGRVVHIAATSKDSSLNPRSKPNTESK